MDKNFEEFRNNIEKISVNIKNCEENYFQTTSEIKGIDKKYSDNEETDQINVILNKFEELKKNEEKVSV